MSQRATVLAGSALALGFSLALAGCAPPPDAAAFPPPGVSVSPALEREVEDFNTFTGRTAAVDSVKVQAHVWGYLKKINFKEGDEVQKDDVLFEIDPRTYQAALDQSKANLTLQEAQRRYNASDYRRNVTLRARDAVSQDDLEKSRAALETSEAAVEAARAAVATCELDVEFTKVRAPVAGRVSRALVTEGNLIQSGQNGGTVLTTIVSQDPVYAYFDVDDLTFLEVSRLAREGKAEAGRGAFGPVWLGLADEEGWPHRGEIDFVDNQVEPGTGTMRFRGKFPNPDRALTPGLFASLRVPVGRKHKATLVAERAVDTDQGQKVVYVVNADNVAEKRPVRLGRLHGGLREVVDGVRPGERVIVDGLQRVRGGAPVQPTEVEPPAGEAKDDGGSIKEEKAGK
jgi:RND family efflux transporter MFP subunit